MRSRHHSPIDVFGHVAAKKIQLSTMLHRDGYGDGYGDRGGDGKRLNLKFIDTGTACVRLYIYVCIYKCVYINIKTKA